MRRCWPLTLICLFFGCALDDGFEDHYSGNYPVSAPVPYQTAPPPLAQQGWASPGPSCGSASGVVPAAYTPQTPEPPR